MLTNRILAVDTGAERTGMVCSLNGETVWAMTMAPWEAWEWVDEKTESWMFDLVILERWVPYPGAEHGNAWRELTEVLTLGAMEGSCRKHDVPYIYQPTSVLKPATAIANAEGYEWVGTNRDEKAAEAHLYYYLNLATQREKQ